MFLPVLASIFLVWGIATRKSGLLIPGGVLAGLGVGTLVIEYLVKTQPDERQSGIFLLCMAAGFCLIPLLSILFTSERHLWALIPASILALIGGVLYIGGGAMQAFILLGKGWPLFLIAAGLYLLLFRRGLKQ